MFMKVSCVIPIYNEAKRITNVLDAIVGHDCVDEIIVVNDGSTDDSEAVLKQKQGIKLISYPINKGKTHALKLGIQTAKNEHVMLIDSDLVGLTKEAITDLVSPVEDKKAKVSISLRKNALLTFKLFGLDFVSGERVFEKQILGNLEELDKLPKFGFEVFLNNIIVKNKMPICIVKWKDVISPRKSVKAGFIKGVIGDAKMAMEIISVLKISGVIKQFFAMRALRKKSDVN